MKIDHYTFSVKSLRSGALVPLRFVKNQRKFPIFLMKNTKAYAILQKMSEYYAANDAIDMLIMRGRPLIRHGFP